MNSQQDVIYGLMNELEEALDKGLPLLGSFSIVRKDTVTNILDKLYAALPDEIKEISFEPLTENEIKSFRYSPYNHQVEAINFGLKKEHSK